MILSQNEWYRIAEALEEMDKLETKQAVVEFETLKFTFTKTPQGFILDVRRPMFGSAVNAAGMTTPRQPGE